MSDETKEWATGTGCFVAFAVVAALVTKWTESNLEFWLSQIKGEPVDVPVLLAFLCFLFGPMTVLMNVFSELCEAVVR